MEWWGVEFCSKFRNNGLKIEPVDPNIEVALEMENENENASTCPIFHKIHWKLMQWQAIKVQLFLELSSFFSQKKLRRKSTI